jgi:hypothetical protein
VAAACAVVVDLAADRYCVDATFQWQLFVLLMFVCQLTFVALQLYKSCLICCSCCMAADCFATAVRVTAAAIWVAMYCCCTTFVGVTADCCYVAAVKGQMSVIVLYNWVKN